MADQKFYFDNLNKEFNNIKEIIDIGRNSDFSDEKIIEALDHYLTPEKLEYMAILFDYKSEKQENVLNKFLGERFDQLSISYGELTLEHRLFSQIVDENGSIHEDHTNPEIITFNKGNRIPFTRESEIETMLKDKYSDILPEGFNWDGEDDWKLNVVSNDYTLLIPKENGKKDNSKKQAKKNGNKNGRSAFQDKEYTEVARIRTRIKKSERELAKKIEWMTGERKKPGKPLDVIGILELYNSPGEARNNYRNWGEDGKGNKKFSNSRDLMDKGSIGVDYKGFKGNYGIGTLEKITQNAIKLNDRLKNKSFEQIKPHRNELLLMAKINANYKSVPLEIMVKTHDWHEISEYGAIGREAYNKDREGFDSHISDHLYEKLMPVFTVNR